jgi:hypothetical protein
MPARASVALLAGLAVVSFALAGCAAGGTGAAAGGSADPVSIIQTRCTVCHGIERINAARHDRTAWAATVTRMRGKGAKLNDAETAAVIDYLTAREVPAPAVPATVGP